MLFDYNGTQYDWDNDFERSELIEEVVKGLEDSDLVYHWNEYLNRADNLDDYIHSMDSLEEYLEIMEVSAYDVLTECVVDFECFNSMDIWFIDTVYGLKSADSPWDFFDFECEDDFMTYMEEQIFNRISDFGVEYLEENEDIDE